MSLSKMRTPRRILILIGAVLGLAGLASCGSTSEVTTAAAAGVSADVDGVIADVAADDQGAADEDHGDEDHGDEDHGDDKEHADEEHDGDEDHADDKEHADEEHADHADHADEDHHEDDHGDDDHDDHDDSSGGFDAHVHGSAELFVAWSGSDVVVDLISPANNIFGFENEPSTDEEQSVAAERTEALTAPGVIAFNSEAGCNLDAVASDVAFEGSHAEISASWMFACANPDAINELDTGALFSEFPGLLDIDAQWASESRQSASELSPSSTVLRFE